MRCLLGSLAAHPENPAPLNPTVYESDMPVFTTDVRMAKVSHLFASGPHPDDGDDASSSATGGGGPVEMVFLAPARSTQWRLAGSAYVLGPNADDDTVSARRVREFLAERMRVVAGGSEEAVKTWSWAREVTALFGNQSRLERGWFRNPPPGMPVDDPLPEKRLALGQCVDDLNDEVARSNFRIVVVVPSEVDQVNMTDPARPRRWQHRFVGGQWETREIWP